MLLQREIHHPQIREKMINVVIIDDSQEISNLLKNFLEKDSNFKVVRIFLDGKSAIDEIESIETGLIILDLSMPISDGFKVLEHIRVKNKVSKVVIFSGHSKKSYEDKVLLLGANLYIEKGTPLSEIKRAIDELFL